MVGEYSCGDEGDNRDDLLLKYGSDLLLIVVTFSVTMFLSSRAAQYS